MYLGSRWFIFIQFNSTCKCPAAYGEGLKEATADISQSQACWFEWPSGNTQDGTSCVIQTPPHPQSRGRNVIDPLPSKRPNRAGPEVMLWRRVDPALEGASQFCLGPPGVPTLHICVSEHWPGPGRRRRGQERGFLQGKTMYVRDVCTLTIVGGGVYLSKSSKW